MNAMLPVFNEYFSPIFAEVGAILASVVRPGIVVGVGYNATNPPITGSEIDYVAHFQDKKQAIKKEHILLIENKGLEILRYDYRNFQRELLCIIEDLDPYRGEPDQTNTCCDQSARTF